MCDRQLPAVRCRMNRNGSVRVLHILHGLARAGTEQLVYELAATNGHRLATAVVCLDHEGQLADELRKKGVPVYHTHRREGIDLRQIARIARIIRSFRPDVIHCHQYTPFFYGCLAHLWARAGRILFTEHGRHFPDVVGWRRRALNQFLARRAAHITAVCEFARRRLCTNEGIRARRIEVLHNGVELSRFGRVGNRAQARRQLGLASDVAVILQVGSFRPVKDQRTAIRAMSVLRSRRKDAVLVFAGDGRDRGPCQRLARDLGLHDTVRFLGLRSDIPRLLAAADIMLLTSLSEACSISLLEGMASWLPVVATDVGGVGETVLHGKTGLLVPPGDADAIATCLLRLLRDAGLRAEMGRAGYERVRTCFLRSDMHRRYMEIYSQLASCGQRP